MKYGDAYTMNCVHTIGMLLFVYRNRRTMGANAQYDRTNTMDIRRQNRTGRRTRAIVIIYDPFRFRTRLRGLIDWTLKRTFSSYQHGWRHRIGKAKLLPQSFRWSNFKHGTRARTEKIMSKHFSKIDSTKNPKPLDIF